MGIVREYISYEREYIIKVFILILELLFHKLHKLIFKPKSLNHRHTNPSKGIEIYKELLKQRNLIPISLFLHHLKALGYIRV